MFHMTGTGNAMRIERPISHCLCLCPKRSFCYSDISRLEYCGSITLPQACIKKSFARKQQNPHGAKNSSGMMYPPGVGSGMW